MTIGSFNVWNLSYHKGAKSKSSTHPDDWKERKVEAIANIIKSNGMDIAALQELKGGEGSAEGIVAKLPPGYDYLHVDRIYGELKDRGFVFPSEMESRGELAFIYRNDKIRVAFDDEHCNMYVEIYRQLQTKYRELIDLLTGVVVGLIGLIPEDDGKKNSKKQLGVGMGGILANGAGSVLGDVAAREKIATMIGSIVRPPLVAFFNVRDNDSQLRFVNAHVRWNLTAVEKEKKGAGLLEGSADKLRKEEIKLLLGYVFKYVDAYPMKKRSSKYTVVGGDFNMACAEMTSSKEKMVDSKMKVVQEELSHLIMVNSKDVKAGCAYPKYAGNANYDHFVFRKDADIWKDEKGQDTAEVCNDGDDDKYFLIPNKMDEKYKWNISDHYPIKMRTAKI